MGFNISIQRLTSQNLITIPGAKYVSIDLVVIHCKEFGEKNVWDTYMQMPNSCLGSVNLATPASSLGGMYPADILRNNYLIHYHAKMTSFWRCNDVIITWSVRWNCFQMKQLAVINPLCPDTKGSFVKPSMKSRHGFLKTPWHVNQLITYWVVTSILLLAFSANRPATGFLISMKQPAVWSTDLFVRDW